MFSEVSSFVKVILILPIAAAVACGVVSSSSRQPGPGDIASLAPASETDVKGKQVAVFAGGCFWGVEAVFEHVKGVSDVRSGYAGGDAKSATYEKVSDGKTGHAEAVKITFDPEKVSYIQLLTIFFAVAHDPTQLNRQGPDVGTQYRSAIFYTSDEQRTQAAAYIEAIDSSKALTKPVVTQVVPLENFFEAEDYHQDYLVKNPNEPYIVIHDKPKLVALKKQFPDLYVK